MSTCYCFREPWWLLRAFPIEGKWMLELDVMKPGTNNHTAHCRPTWGLFWASTPFEAMAAVGSSTVEDSKGKTSAGARTAAPRPSTAPQLSGHLGGRPVLLLAITERG